MAMSAYTPFSHLGKLAAALTFHLFRISSARKVELMYYSSVLLFASMSWNPMGF